MKGERPAEESTNAKSKVETSSWWRVKSGNEQGITTRAIMFKEMVINPLID